jgi:hypothetical protein
MIPMDTRCVRESEWLCYFRYFERRVARFSIEAGVTPRVIKMYDVNDNNLANSRTFITQKSQISI